MSEEEHRTAVTLTTVSADHPNLQASAKNPDGVERRIIVLFVLGLVGFLLFGYCYWTARAPWTLGATLGGGLLLVGIGVIAWAKYLMPRGPFVEERHEFAGTDVEREAFVHAIVERGTGIFKRRKILGGLFGAGVGTFSIVALFPLLRSLGPLPGKSLAETNWKKGSFLVDNTGRRVQESDLSIGSAMTVFPEGYENDPDSQAVDQVFMVRVSDRPFTTMKGRSSWTPAGYVAYSKLCTHLGCPVGLYEQEKQLLVCPCHQSMFNVTNGCIPQFGPAPRPLPQLPLYIDTNGFLRSQSGFHEAVGPAYWERP